MKVSNYFKTYFLLIFVGAFDLSVASSVSIQNNSYSGIVVAIHPDIPENPQLLQKIQEIWTEASATLFVATHQRAYFGSVTILVPSTWTNRSYEQAINETYNAADVLIANPNPVYQNGPYTLQYGRCGEPGAYIHLTPPYVIDPSFVRDFGPKDKTIVHEWAHYRWGVYDETSSDESNPFYLNSLRKVEAVRCPEKLQGVTMVADSKTGKIHPCKQDYEKKNGLFEDGCFFIPTQVQPDGLTTSFMSHPYLKEVVHFCDKQTHNIEAPNDQNRLCDLQSTWDVILQSPDFADGANPPLGGAIDSTPIFRVLQQGSSRRHVLVLDTSGSMEGARLQKMKQVVNRFISQFIPDEDEIAIVEFNGEVAELSGLKRLSGADDRSELLQSIPDRAGGATCIGCGIQQAVTILERNGKNPGGGNVIVFTDGEETRDPYVQDVRADALAKRVIVHAIFFATASNPNLESLVRESGGVWFYGGETSISSILEAFVSLAASQDGNKDSEVFQVHSSTFDIEANNEEVGYVTLDDALGNNTVFSFAWPQLSSSIDVRLEPPSGCVYDTRLGKQECSDIVSLDVDLEFQIITFNILGVAEVGTWMYTISSSTNQKITASVTSKVSDNSIFPVQVRTGYDQTRVGTGEALVIYAQVSHNFAPVLNAKVVAMVELPDGKTKDVKLLDKGSAPDARKNDGVYSGYFTGYQGPGRYATKVIVTNMVGNNTAGSLGSGRQMSKAQLIYGIVNRDGSVTLNANVPKYMNPTMPPVDVGNFSRVVGLQGFEYTGIPVTENMDIFPPSRITDLTAALVSVNSTFKIMLKFSAPGSDYDSGTGDYYELRYIVDNLTQLRDDFESCIRIYTSNLTQGNLSTPGPAGTNELLLFDPLEPTGPNGTLYGFALRAYDASSNVAPPSNVAILNYVLNFPEEETESPEVSTETPEVSTETTKVSTEAESLEVSTTDSASMLYAAKLSVFACFIMALCGVN